MQQVPRSKAKIQSNFTGSPDVADAHRNCPELSKLTSTIRYNRFEKKETLAIANDQKVDATLIIN